MPIAGAPRTTIVLIASATSSAVRHSTSTSSSGSLRWSRNTTRSSSRRRIRSGASKHGLRAGRVRPPERCLRHGEQAVGLEERHALDRAWCERAEHHRDDEPRAVLDDRGDGNAVILAAELPEDRDGRAAGEVDPGERRSARGRKSCRKAGGRGSIDCDERHRRGLHAAGTPTHELAPVDARTRRRGEGERRAQRRAEAQVPSSHEARYFACSSVSWSIVTPIVRSLRRAISSSISRGTGYTFRSSEAAFWIAYSVARAWFANDMSITIAGWPSAAEMLTRRPSASRNTRRPSA